MPAPSTAPIEPAPASALSPPPPAASPAATFQAGAIELSNIRQTIARRLVESKTTIPHYQVTIGLDMQPLIDLRKTLNDQLAEQGVKLSVNDFLVRACALAIHEQEFLHGTSRRASLDLPRRYLIVCRER